MPTTDCAAHAASPDAQDFDCPIEVSASTSQGTSRPLRGLFFGFAATVTIGLALASWYVGVRIVSADQGGPASAVAEPVAAPQAAPSLAEDPIAEAYWYTGLAPQFYLQVAGLGERKDAAFVRSLQEKGFRAEVALSQGRASQGDAGRILIGPFSTHTEMERAQSKLESWGVLAIEAEH